MFEKYTEAARRSIFMARYEASQFGTEYIDTEQLLLGIFRTDKPLAVRLGIPYEKMDTLRKNIEEHYPARPARSTSVDLPLSHAAKRALGSANQEAMTRGDKHIGTAHLLLGIFLEGESYAAQLLRENSITREKLIAEIENPTAEDPPMGEIRGSSTSRDAPPRPSPGRAVPLADSPEEVVRNFSEIVRNLSAAARGGLLSPLIGREREMQRIVHILARRTHNHVILLGEAGVGKTAIVHGLAQRIVNGEVPPYLEDRPVFSVDANSLIAPSRRGRSTEVPAKLSQIITHPNGILCLEGLLDVAARPGWGGIEALHVFESLSRVGIRCIATGTPDGLRGTLEHTRAFLRHFEIIPIAPPTEDEAVGILTGLLPEYERFYDVTFGPGVVEAAVFASARFLPHRHLPDRAIDLLDEAGACAKVRQARTPAVERDSQARIQRLIREMEDAIVAQQFDKVRDLSEQERDERQILHGLREQRHAGPAVVSVIELEEAIAGRCDTTVAAVQAVLLQKKGKEPQNISRILGSGVPTGDHAWMPFLAAWLAASTEEEAARLAQAILDAKRSVA